MDLDKLRNAVKRRRIFWNKHSFERMLERNISRSDVFEIILSGEIIREYKDDKPFPSSLIFGYAGKTPLHVIAALNENSDICHVITVYQPDEKHFEHDFKTRKRR